MDNDNKDIVISVKNVSKRYKLYKTKTDRMKEALSVTKKSFHQDFYALHNVNLEIKKGEILGIVGRNGSGKSTLLKIISGILQPSEGEVKTKGKIIPLLELGNGFNPEFTGLENIYFYNSVLGFSRKETDARLQDILDFAEIGEFIHQPLKTYSSGMKARLAFAVSVNIDPDILIVDEVLSVGDELFKRKSYARMEEFFKAGKTVLFVSHNVQSVNSLCKNAVLIDKGNILLEGDAKTVTKHYQKMLYAKKENIKEVKEEIKQEKLKFEKQRNANPENLVKKEKPRILDIQANDEKPDEESYLIKEFVPKSTVRTGDAKIEFDNIKIKNNKGETVNQLVPGFRYWVCFDINCSEEFHGLNIGVDFKDQKGFQYAGLSTRYSKLIIQEVNFGDTIHAEYSFINRFIEGLYFIDLGANEVINPSSPFLIKLYDAICFKVIKKEHLDINKYGMIDLDIIPNINHITGK